MFFRQTSAGWTSCLNSLETCVVYFAVFIYNTAADIKDDFTQSCSKGNFNQACICNMACQGKCFCAGRAFSPVFSIFISAVEKNKRHR